MAERIWLVTYDGLWLGGKAIVRACTEAQAIDRVKHDAATVTFTNVEAEEVLGPMYYNDNGNY